MNKHIEEVLKALSNIERNDIPSLTAEELYVVVRMTRGLVVCLECECELRGVIAAQGQVH